MVELCPRRAYGGAGIPQSDRTRRTVGRGRARRHRRIPDRVGSGKDSNPDIPILTSIKSNSRLPLPTFRSRCGSSFGINITKPFVTLMWLCGDLFSFSSSPLFMATTRTSRPSLVGLNGAPGASMYRVANSFERSSSVALALLLVSAFRRDTPDIPLQDSGPEAVPCTIHCTSVKLELLR